MNNNLLKETGTPEYKRLQNERKTQAPQTLKPKPHKIAKPQKKNNQSPRC